MENSEPIIISALNHYLYCPRRCALVHVEQIWSENLYTMRGNEVHENVHEESSHETGGIRYERALPIWSRRLKIIGKADMVEFQNGIPYPIEYKAGQHKEYENNYIQLCAQAICLEEMFGVSAPRGALYWHGSRERKEIVFTEAMRVQVEEVTSAIHEMVASRIIPPPVNDKRCSNCSLKESCLPQPISDKSVSRKAAKALFEVTKP